MFSFYYFHEQIIIYALLSGSPRETPPTKRVKLETLASSFGKDMELNTNAKKNTDNKKDEIVKNDIGGKKDLKPKGLCFLILF